MPDTPLKKVSVAEPEQVVPPKDEDEIVLVDEHDRPVGYAGKLAAHRNGGRLHRAFSVFVFDAAGRMLIQQRAATKYHFGGLWSNTCCSHPRPGQAVAEAAEARLQFELGFTAPLTPLFTFIYNANDPISGLTEHEFDHVFFARFDGVPTPNPDEVSGWEWVDPPTLHADVVGRPQRYTPWFRLVLERVLGDRAARIDAGGL